jgi:hypothetical protein
MKTQLSTNNRPLGPVFKAIMGLLVAGTLASCSGHSTVTGQVDLMRNDARAAEWDAMALSIDEDQKSRSSIPLVSISIDL